MAHEVTLITGDGVGPELAEAARRCVDDTYGLRLVSRLVSSLDESPAEGIALT